MSAVLLAPPEVTSDRPRFQGDSDPSPLTFLGAAQRIAAKLCRDAVWSRGRCNWLGWAMEPVEGQFVACYRTCGPELYSGTAGIALFLGQLHRLAPDEEVRETLEGAAAFLVEQTTSESGRALPGFYTGLMGMGYALVRLGELLGREAWVAAGLRAVAGGGAADDGRLHDVLSGSAGLIPALLDLAVRCRRPELIEQAGVHARRLASAALQTERGAFWPNPEPGAAPLLGYSHGSAGMAAGLLEFHRAVPDDGLLHLAREALRYERSCFNPAEGNWPDFRPQPGQVASLPGYPVAWCHGATGIGLSRLRLLEFVADDPQLRPEVDAALQTASRYLSQPKDGFLRDFSYCHGLAASAEFLLEVGQQMGRPDILEAARHVGRFGIAQYGQTGWPCGVRVTGETPGLMLGTAGIGYFMLRLHAPDQVPSLLVLRPSAPPPKPSRQPVAGSAVES
jgi:lantibiotic biosynthesis protein